MTWTTYSFLRLVDETSPNYIPGYGTSRYTARDIVSVSVEGESEYLEYTDTQSPFRQTDVAMEYVPFDGAKLIIDKKSRYDFRYKIPQGRYTGMQGPTVRATMFNNTSIIIKTPEESVIASFNSGRNPETILLRDSSLVLRGSTNTSLELKNFAKGSNLFKWVVSWGAPDPAEVLLRSTISGSSRKNVISIQSLDYQLEGGFDRLESKGVVSSQIDLKGGSDVLSVNAVTEARACYYSTTQTTIDNIDVYADCFTTAVEGSTITTGDGNDKIDLIASLHGSYDIFKSHTYAVSRSKIFTGEGNDRLSLKAENIWMVEAPYFFYPSKWISASQDAREFTLVDEYGTVLEAYESTLDMGPGDDIITGLNNARFTTVNLGEGNDKLINTSMTGEAMSGNNTMFGGDNTIDGGAGYDKHIFATFDWNTIMNEQSDRPERVRSWFKDIGKQMTPKLTSKQAYFVQKFTVGNPGIEPVQGVREEFSWNGQAYHNFEELIVNGMRFDPASLSFL